MFSHGCGNMYPAMKCVNTDFVGALEAKYPLIIDYGTKVPEYMKNRFIRLIGFNNLCYDPDCKLCSKTELLPDVPVDDSLQKDLVVEPPFKRYPGDKVTCFVEFDEGIHDRFLLIIIGKQLYLEGFKHNTGPVIQYILVSQFLPPLKIGLSCD